MSVDSAPSTTSGPLPQSMGSLLPLGSGPLPSPLPSRANEAAAAGGERRGCYASFKAAVKRLKRQVLALHYANQDPRTGLLPRMVILLALAYALSPIDLIPDVIPVLGLVDDLLILPGLLALAVWLIPADVMETARQRAEHEPLRLHRAWAMAALVFAMWDALLLWLAWWACSRFGGEALQQHKVWIVVGCGVALVAAELGWMVAAHRKEAQYTDALNSAGAEPDLQQALLANGSDAVQEYLEP